MKPHQAKKQLTKLLNDYDLVTSEEVKPLVYVLFESNKRYRKAATELRHKMHRQKETIRRLEGGR